ncbi:hypothetical protein A2Z10_01615 [Candidatus Azambacteria bacterium RBG_16_47_10]|uniref:Uncharacterized protein n=1 Tax=Candidatus Azambacteria bacterium RBG_16_47_10 TaxID=1797292 RepID=A0A1F5AZI6_9BACT|nr:MAG: hypothetical protein A2Z10_01615 [Candidatus Azambacteria bacterium RBG_16_47_10]
MHYYLKKLAVSGAISATLFALFFYFVYQAESAEYEPQASAGSEKIYTEETVNDVNTIVTQTIEQEIARNAKKIANMPTIQRISTGSLTQAPTSETPQTSPLSIPSLPPAIQPTPIAIPNSDSIAIPTIPAAPPALAPKTAVTIAPVTSVQQKPKASAPRTTVS